MATILHKCKTSLWRLLYGIGYGNFKKKTSQPCISDSHTDAKANPASCTLFKGDQSSSQFLSHFVSQTGGGYDIVIDDGSHVPAHVLLTFETLWPSVKEGGVYVVEDIETNYWKPSAKVYGYSLEDQPNLVRRWKQVVDTINREFNHGRSDLTDEKPSVYSDIESIEFGQNVVIFRKAFGNEASWLSRKYRSDHNIA